jgi:hypothetical protein
MSFKIPIVISALLFSLIAYAQTDSTSVVAPVEAKKEEKKPEEKKEEKKWFETLSIRGYTQIRYNRFLETNEDLKCEQCDRSWGKDGGFFIRRMRIIFFGQISKQVYFYIQPDFASSVSSSSLHFAQLRDAYFDLGIDKQNRFRIRLGQSKIPYGFENLQSSQNRLPLDRNDALNSALTNERDLGMMLYWAPTKARKLYSELVRSGLKGSGDYGVIGFGVYNGQTANRPDLNDEMHLAARVSVPITIGSQIIEPGIQAYSGRFVIPKDQISTGTKIHSERNFLDERAAASFVLYPKPFGIQAEYNIGHGPEFNTQTDSIELKKLEGGYVTLSYMQKLGSQYVIPFVRIQKYSGGKKHELDARSYRIEEYEIGVEWQPVKQFELVAMYTISSRRFEDFAKQNNLQEGRLLRLQAQINF